MNKRFVFNKIFKQNTSRFAIFRDGGTGKAPRHVPNLKSEVYLIVFWRKFAF